MTLCGQMVDLIRLNVINEIGELPLIGDVPIMKKKLCFRIVRVGIQVIDSIGIKGAGPANESMDFITLQKKKLGKITAILTSDAGN